MEGYQELDWDAKESWTALGALIAHLIKNGFLKQVSRFVYWHDFSWQLCLTGTQIHDPFMHGTLG